VAESLRDLAARDGLSAAALNEARERLYGTTLRLACERATGEDLEEIAGKLREIDAMAEAGDMQRRAAAALDFFDVLCKAAHNPVLATVARSLGTLMKQQVHASASASNWGNLRRPELTPIRWRILERLRERDPEGAVAALADYVRMSPLATWNLPAS